MNKKTYAVIGVLLVVGILIGGISLLRYESDPADKSNGINDQLNGENKTEPIGVVSSSDREVLVPYSPEALAVVSEGDNEAVIFFHASWCPTCQAAEADIRSNVSQIPENVTILKADYDTEEELKDKYGITYQHTFVHVDENGEELNKWNGGGVETILENI